MCGWGSMGPVGVCRGRGATGAEVYGVYRHWGALGTGFCGVYGVRRGREAVGAEVYGVCGGQRLWCLCAIGSLCYRGWRLWGL